MSRSYILNIIGRRAMGLKSFGSVGIHPCPFLLRLQMQGIREKFGVYSKVDHVVNNMLRVEHNLLFWLCKCGRVIPSYPADPFLFECRIAFSIES